MDTSKNNQNVAGVAELTPEPVFIRSLTQLRNIDGVKKNDMFAIHISLLKEEPGFNARDYSKPRYVKHIESLANQWIDNPSMIPPLMFVLKDGHAYVRDGHCRRRGALLANERLGKDEQIEYITCVPFRGNDLDQDLLILNSQMGEQLDYVEKAMMYERLANRGLTDDDIGARVKRSAQHVRVVRQIAMLPQKMQDYISEDVISYIPAIELVKQKGETKAVQIMDELVAELRAKVEASCAQSAPELPADPVTPVVEGGDATLTGTGTEGEQNNAPAEPPKAEEPPKVRVTQATLNKKLGGNKQRFTPTVKTTTVSLIKSLSAQIVPGQATATLTLTPDQVAAILALKDQLLEMEAPEDDSGDGKHPHDVLVEGGDEEPVVAPEVKAVAPEVDGDDKDQMSFTDFTVEPIEGDDISMSAEDIAALDQDVRNTSFF